MTTFRINGIEALKISFLRYGLSIGAACAPLVLGLMYLLGLRLAICHHSTLTYCVTRHVAPIAWPIAKLLDLVLGVHGAHTYKKAELKSFLQFHRTGEEPLRDDEISILNGVLELNTKNVEQIMTPIQVDIFWLYLLDAKLIGGVGCCHP